ncbi:CBS domain-containing protein [Allosalinactinospora lopnorensis]|uniref:CBS domain-containing protein n=1 Tax=Allosalinactinospora lopnorensis TaxID=1352348 RepID=UPI0009E33CD9|nr:CBS domain-containing protein [Allosalinactinospora lopnorensis]
MRTTVRDVMDTDVVSIGPKTPFKEIARLLVLPEVSALPVIEDDRVVGIVSETDLAHNEEFGPGDSGDDYREPVWARLRHSLSSAPGKARAERASGLMARNVVTAHLEDSIVVAARAMDHHDVKQLPVVDGHGRLIGLLSRRDLLRVFARSDRNISWDISAAFIDAPAWLGTRHIRFTVDGGVVTLEEGRAAQSLHHNQPARLRGGRCRGCAQRAHLGNRRHPIDKGPCPIASRCSLVVGAGLLAPPGEPDLRGKCAAPSLE